MFAIEKKASQLSCVSISTPSRISGRQNVFQRHIYAGADTSNGSVYFLPYSSLFFCCHTHKKTSRRLAIDIKCHLKLQSILYGYMKF